MVFDCLGLPKLEVWQEVLFTPLVRTFLAYLLYDHYILGGAVPYVASYVAGQVASKFKVEPQLEMCLVVVLVFVMVVISCRCFFESEFWKQLFTLDDRYYWILAARDCINSYSIYCNFSRLLKIIFDTDSNSSWGFKKNYFGEGVPIILLQTLNSQYMIPLELHNTDSYPMYGGAYCDSYCEKLKEECINSAEFSLSIALLASSLARLLYINTLYSYTTAVKLFSDVNPFFQRQLQPECNDFCQQTTPEKPTSLMTKWFNGSSDWDD